MPTAPTAMCRENPQVGQGAGFTAFACAPMTVPASSKVSAYRIAKTTAGVTRSADWNR
jgi:hypothetical protein